MMYPFFLPAKNITTLQKTCGQLSEMELNNMIFSLWKKSHHDTATTINYTFDLSALPLLFELRHALENGGSVLNASDALQQEVNRSLNSWRAACSSHLAFRYVAKAKDAPILDGNNAWNGIVFAACEQTAVMGQTHAYSLPIKGNDLVDGHPEMISNIVCLPVQIQNNYDRHTLSHEIGHAIGLEHFHDNPAIKNRLQQTKEGLGCSVMPYQHEIRKGDLTHCLTKDVCLNESYAINPGPLDRDACTRMYHPKRSEQDMATDVCMNMESYEAPYLSHATAFSFSMLSGLKRSLILSAPNVLDAYLKKQGTSDDTKLAAKIGLNCLTLFANKKDDSDPIFLLNIMLFLFIIRSIADEKNVVTKNNIYTGYLFIESIFSTFSLLLSINALYDIDAKEKEFFFVCSIISTTIFSSLIQQYVEPLLINGLMKATSLLYPCPNRENNASYQRPAP